MFDIEKWKILFCSDFFIWRVIKSDWCDVKSKRMLKKNEIIGCHVSRQCKTKFLPKAFVKQTLIHKFMQQ